MDFSQITTEELERIFPHLINFEHIKSGGEGAVFKAFSSINNDHNAIKIFFANSGSCRTRYEFDKLKDKSIPYLAKIYNFSDIQLNGQKYFYTETQFIDGTDLRELIKLGFKFSESQVIDLILCISEAIQNLWSEKIIHCDINPNNIMSTTEDNYYLIDMGIAKHLDKDTVTLTGNIMGTLGYMAPEQLSGRGSLTLKADFYSLGIVAYELLVGFHPFLHNQSAIFAKQEPALLNENQCKSDQLRKAINDLTRKQPYKRPLNFKMIKNILQE